MYKRNSKLYILAIAFWLSIWQLVSSLMGQEILLVSPLSALSRLGCLSLETYFWKTVWYSFSKISLGFFLAFILGIGMALLGANFRSFRVLIQPLMATIQAIPVVSFIILCLIWVSSRNLSVLISFLLVLPIIYTNVLTGIDSINSSFMDLAKVFKMKRSKIIRYIYLSEVYPHLKSATYVSLGLCWKSGIAAEVIGMPNMSIGEKLYQAKIYLSTGDLFAWTLVIIVLSVAFRKVFMALMDRLVDSLSI
ncbi:ABC transporter permease [Peptostreptococcus stomatis]|uniref:ABC transporter permease n=1 Tax=Peptostreptococcus stomatis TaxID=341694 RepID=UPI002805846A|nr:ABC transporter permease subunit [Peptostreptococcus stomatis]